MTAKHLFQKTLALTVALLLTAARSHAASYHVTVNTAPLNSLPASANAPFYLDFQLASGGVEGNNTISLSNFTFTGIGAGPTGAASIFGIASGSLSTSVSLTDSFAPSELFQQFTSGTLGIGFDVTTTTNLDAGQTPDRFSVAILDASQGQITTNSPDTLSLMTYDITNVNPLGGNLQFFQGTGDYAGVSAVPEPGTVLFGTALLGAVGMARRRNRKTVIAA